MARSDKRETAILVTPRRDSRTIETAYEYCQTNAKESSTNFYYAIRTLPRAERQAIYAIYAFSRLCDDIVDQPDYGRKPADLLNSVRERIDSTYDGHPSGDIWIALNDAATRFGILRHHFHDIVDGVEMDLTTARYTSFIDLREYCLRVASAVGLICIEICGYADARAEEFVRDLGIGMQITNILRDVSEDIENCRIYLPMEDLRQFNYSENDLQSKVIDERFKSLMAFQVTRARLHFDNGRRLFPLLKRQFRACPEAMVAVYSGILDRIERAEYDVYSNRIGLSGFTKVSLALNLWLRTRIPALS